MMITTISLHDALPICSSTWSISTSTIVSTTPCGRTTAAGTRSAPGPSTSCTSTGTTISSSSSGTTMSPYEILQRSEEHTSELQSHSDLICRLLLENKK